MNVSERRQNILELLCIRRMDTYHNLAQEFGVSVMTIRRDIAYLMCHHPIETIRGKHGGVRVADGYYLQRRFLSMKQIHLLKRLSLQLEGDDLDTMNSILVQFASNIAL